MSNSSKTILMLLFALINFGVAAQYSSDSLFAYYAFDEDEIIDESPSQRHGVAYDTFFLETSGRKNGSHEFNGSSSYVELFSDNFETFSINIWFKTFEETKNQRLFHKGDRGGSASYPWSYSGVFAGEKFRFSIANYVGVGALMLYTDTIHNPDEWHMITCVFNNETLYGKVYLDAVLQDSGYADNPLIPTSDPLQLSYYPFSADEQIVNGELDELGLWQRELTQSDIDILYGIQSCDTSVVDYDTTSFFVSSPEFEAISPQLNFVSLDSLQTIQGCDSLVYRYNLFEFNPSFCSDTVTVTDTLFVTDTNYVSVEDTLNIFLNVTDISGNELVNELRVYPNPTSEILTIDYGNYSSIDNYEMKIVDALGSVVWSENVKAQQSIINIEIFERGIYYLLVADSKGTRLTTRKLVFK